MSEAVTTAGSASMLPAKARRSKGAVAGLLALYLTLATNAVASDPSVIPPPPPPPDEPNWGAPTPRPPRDPSKPQRDPTLRQKFTPRFPRDAACAGKNGSTTLVLKVDENGRVTKALVEKSGRHRELDRAAVEAGELTLFNPEIYNGVAIASMVRLPFDFIEPAQPPAYCALSVDLRKPIEAGQAAMPQAGEDAAPRVFAAGDRIEAIVSQYAFAPTRVLASWKRIGNGAATRTVQEHSRDLPASESRQSSEFVLSQAPTLPQGEYLLEIFVDGQSHSRHRFSIR